MNDTKKDATRLTGVVHFESADEGSKSESVRPRLHGDDGSVTLLLLRGDNPFENAGLRPYDGKRIEAIGAFGRSGAFVAESVSEQTA